MAKKKSKKVIRYRRPLNINVGMIIFFIIFIYLVFSVYTYLKREKIQFYEVVDGGIVNNRIYNGLILREEQVRTADRSGYINYYLREGKRASVGSRIYSLDETGNLEALLKENAEEGSSLSDDSLSDLKKQLTSFVLSFQNQDFGTIYDARISLDASVMEYSSFSTLDQLDKLAEQSGAVFEQVRSDVSGVVSYGIDSFESMTTSDVEAASFDRSTYVKTVHKSGDLIDSGSPAYKIVTSEKWSIVFPLSEEDAALYNDKTVLRVVFRDYSLSTPAAYSTFTGKDGAAYGKLDVEMEKLNLDGIMKDWLEYIRIQCQESGTMAVAVRRKGKSLKGCIAKLLIWSMENAHPVPQEVLRACKINYRVTLGIPDMGTAKEIIKKYYLEG